MTALKSSSHSIGSALDARKLDRSAKNVGFSKSLCFLTWTIAYAHLEF